MGVLSTLGQPVRRREDARLLAGRGEFLDDIRIDGTLHMAFVRSPHAHARIRGIDTSRALELPGVIAVLTGAELVADGVKPIPHKSFSQRTSDSPARGSSIAVRGS